MFKAAGSKVDYKIGTMIEVPRGALIAGQLAKTAEFFSFGTNDLTQMTFGISRDDAQVCWDTCRWLWGCVLVGMVVIRISESVDQLCVVVPVSKCAASASICVTFSRPIIMLLLLMCLLPFTHSLLYTPPPSLLPPLTPQAKFLQYYTKNGLLALDPFETVDSTGVGELIRLAVARGREARPNIELGICGEHGGDPKSIELFEAVGLDYVSCSPLRVPIARLAAAQALLKLQKAGKA